VRRPFECGAVLGHRWPEYHSIAGSTVPACVSAASVSEVGEMADEDLVLTDGVRFGTAQRMVVLLEASPTSPSR
jgi:DNA-directed RNA polymerase subunit N (RpoN/RPB10)